MLKEGFMEPTASEWSSPIVLAPKADGSLRLCVCYRRLILVRKLDSYPLLVMDDCMESLGQAKIFTTLDAYWGYWKLLVKEKDKNGVLYIRRDMLIQKDAFQTV